MDISSFTPSTALITVILLALAPFLAVMLTSFTKIVVVLSLLRNALGLQQSPPNVVLNGLALILSVYVMYPVGQQMAAVVPTELTETGLNDADSIFKTVDSAKEPLREFLIEHSPQREREFFLSTAKRAAADGPGADLTARDFVVIIPAFTVSELTKAFQIGFLIFLPFLLIDLVISNILLAMGMMMLSPTIISLPFKLLLFIMLEGWVKIAHNLVLSY